MLAFRLACVVLIAAAERYYRLPVGLVTSEIPHSFVDPEHHLFDANRHRRLWRRDTALRRALPKAKS
jgi:hypothetical protein